MCKFLWNYFIKKHTQYLTTLDVSNKPNNYNYDIL
jgi:hypothetical protein